MLDHKIQNQAVLVAAADAGGQVGFQLGLEGVDDGGGVAGESGAGDSH